MNFLYEPSWPLPLLSIQSLHAVNLIGHLPMIFVVLIYYFVYIDCSNMNSFDNHLLSNSSVLDIELYGKVTKVNMEKKNLPSRSSLCSWSIDLHSAFTPQDTNAKLWKWQWHQQDQIISRLVNWQEIQIILHKLSVLHDQLPWRIQSNDFKVLLFKFWWFLFALVCWPTSLISAKLS